MRRRNSNDGVDESAEPVDATLNAVSGLDCADSGGCTGVDEIPWDEFEVRRQLGNQLRHRPDQIFEVRLLAHLAVDGEPDAPLRQMPGRRYGVNGAAASGPIAYSKIVNETFIRHRGVALGLSMTGIGIAAAAIPPVFAGVIAEQGWRSGYQHLARVPLLGAVLTAVLLPSRHAMGVRKAAQADVAQSAQWLRSPVFWMLGGTFAMISLSFMGLVPHFVPMLGDAGVDPRTAGKLAGEIGLAVIASRMLVGFALDRIFAPRIAIVICLVAAAGILAFRFLGVGSASVTAIAMGLALGAELDLMGFLIARYFGLAQFGKIYGWLYFAFIFASGIGPLWVGAVRDGTGNYSTALVVSAIGLLVSCGGFLMMPRYPDQARTAS